MKKKKKVQQYGHEQYKNLPEYEKQKLFDYRKKIIKKKKRKKARKKRLIIIIRNNYFKNI